MTDRTTATEPTSFDPHAAAYDEQHRANIAMGGEDPEYYARYKARMMKQVLGDLPGGTILDFGCAIGNLTAMLRDEWSPEVAILGYDPAPKCVEIASTRVPGARFTSDLDGIAEGSLKAIVVANVLHHIPPVERQDIMTKAARLLEPGGTFFVFEHNPYNPLTQYIVKACPFDEGVTLLKPKEIRTLLKTAGVRQLTQDYIVFFPKALAMLRPLEKRITWLPAGAQTCTWGVR